MPRRDTLLADLLAYRPELPYSVAMNDRGWGWTPTEIREAQLIEWISEQSPDQFISVQQFYENLPDPWTNSWDVAYADLQRLERQSLVKQSTSMGGMSGLRIHQFQGARAAAEEMHAMRSDKRTRRQACRDAMVDWLHALDATRPDEMANRDDMLADPRHGIWFAQPFSDTDLDEAAAWLKRNGLVDGVEVAEASGPIKLYLTDVGIECAEAFQSHADSYIDALRQAPADGPIFNIGSNSGLFQVAGDNARQVQSVGVSLEQVRDMIEGIVETVIATVPGAVGADMARLQAMEGLSNGDQSALERFRDWAVSTAKAGASSGVVAVISSATTMLLMNAGHLLH